MRTVVIVLALLAVSGCGGSADARFPPEGCPVADPALCARAATAAEALTAGDIDALLTVSGQETFRCDELPADLFPDCTPGRVLRGYARAGAQPAIHVLDPAEFRAELAGIVDRVDASYTDERGTGELRIIGIGTCGPPDPAARSYHLAFTASLSGEAGPQRWLGSLEFALRGGVWVFALVYADSMAAWRQVYTDPFTEFACGNVRPWSAG